MNVQRLQVWSAASEASDSYSLLHPVLDSADNSLLWTYRNDNEIIV